jgi:hypothetical protein
MEARTDTRRVALAGLGCSLAGFVLVGVYEADWTELADALWQTGFVLAGLGILLGIVSLVRPRAVRWVGVSVLAIATGVLPFLYAAFVLAYSGYD